MRPHGCAKEVPGAPSAPTGAPLSTGRSFAERRKLLKLLEKVRDRRARCDASGGPRKCLGASLSVGYLTLCDAARVGFPTLNARSRDAELAGVDEDADFLQALPARRIATRYVVRIAAGLHVGGRVVDGTIVDISDSGARVDCEPPGVAPGTSLAIELRCFRLEERIRMLATLVRETTSGCALRLVDPDPFLRVFVKLARLHDEVPGDRREKLLSEL